MPAPPPIDYATPTGARLPSELHFRLAIAGWAIAAGVATLLLLGYAVTGWNAVTLLGVLWLFAGGAITTAASFAGATYSRRAAAVKYGAPHTRRRAMLATLLPTSNVLLAIAFLVAGGALVARESMRMRVVIDNPSAEAVDDVVIVLPDGSRRSLGGIAPHASRRASFLVPDHGGDVDLDATRATHTWRQHVAEYVDADDLSPRPRRVSLDEPAK